MTDEEYAETQQNIIMLAAIVRDLELSEFIRRIGHAEAVGPILDPSLWIRASTDMDHIKELAQGLRQFQQAIESVDAKHGAQS